MPSTPIDSILLLKMFNLFQIIFLYSEIMKQSRFIVYCLSDNCFYLPIFSYSALDESITLLSHQSPSIYNYLPQSFECFFKFGHFFSWPNIISTKRGLTLFQQRIICFYIILGVIVVTSLGKVWFPIKNFISMRPSKLIGAGRVFIFIFNFVRQFSKFFSKRQ